MAEVALPFVALHDGVLQCIKGLFVAGDGFATEGGANTAVIGLEF